MKGGTSGIGENTCTLFNFLKIGFQLSKKGHNCIIFGRNKEKIDFILQKLSIINDKQCHFGLVCEITDHEDIKEKLKIVEEKYQNINHLINCAGYINSF
jgi:short-subunit dehydrogenase involved in D-alanine esterification of teichoic acids